MSEAIVVQNVTKKFGSQYQPLSRRISGTGLLGYPLTGSRQPAFSALEDVTFRVQSGEIFGVVGPHGSGKTTLVHLLGGLLPPDNGTLQVFGHDIVRQPAQARAFTNRISGQASFFQRLSAGVLSADRVIDCGPLCVRGWGDGEVLTDGAGSRAAV